MMRIWMYIMCMERARVALVNNACITRLEHLLLIEFAIL